MRAETATKDAASGGRDAVEVRSLLMALAGLFLLNLLLRIFYLRFDFVNGDEAVRALTATSLLDGARLYTDVVTDKPPGTTFFYAAVFALFGRSMNAVHLVAALWNFLTATVVYLAAASLYNRRTGVWAALAFVYFGTNYLTPDMMAANTEILMALPYSAAFYLFIKAHTLEKNYVGRAAFSHGLRPQALLVGAGLMTGVAALFKQVAVFNLAFFALYEIFEAAVNHAPARSNSTDQANPTGWILSAARRAATRLLAVGAGFALVVGLLIAWLISTGAVENFWRYSVTLGILYKNALPGDLWWRFMLSRVFGYVLFNAALWSLATWTIVRAAIETVKRRRNRVEAGGGHETDMSVTKYARFDLVIALWAAMSLSGVFTGGRFFGHYFIQVLPALSLLAGRGVVLLGQALSDTTRKGRARAALFAIAVLFFFGLVRFHQRTAILAYESVTGTRTRWSQEWGMSVREREAESIAQALRDRISPGEPLYVWDYGLDVYWRTGCRPASRYLTPYYITGRWPEISSEPAPPDEPFWPEERARLIEDLSRTRPRLIVDISGSLLHLPYKQLVDFVRENYRYEESIGTDPARPYMLYRLK